MSVVVVAVSAKWPPVRRSSAGNFVFTISVFHTSVLNINY